MARRYLTLGALAAIVISVFVISNRADERERRAETEYPPLGQFIEVDGRQVHVYVTGDGPDLVLLHGAGGNLRDFVFAFADQLSDRYRVIIFDRPGLGYTDRTDPAYDTIWGTQAESPREQAALLQSAAAQLGVSEPIVVGHSYGGAVAYAWAVYHPDNVAGIVSLGGVAMPWPGELGAFYTVPGSTLGGAIVPPLVTSFVSEERVRRGIDGTFSPNPVPEGYAEFIGGALALRRDTFRANTRQVNTLRPHIVEQSQLYASLDLPVAMVHGDADETVPLSVHSGPASAIIPGAELIVLPGVGHMPHHVDPEAVISAIDGVARRAGLR